MKRSALYDKVSPGDDNMNKRFRGSLALCLATLIWGSTFVAQSVGMDHVEPFTFQAVRCLLAVIGLTPVIWLTDWKQGAQKSFFSRWADKKLWIAGIICGIPLSLACNLQQLALVDTDAGKSAFLTAMYIVMVPILGIFLKKKATFMIPISVVLAVCGLYCLSCMGATGISTGDLLLLGCAFMFAVQIVAVDYFAGNCDPLRLNAIQALVCAVLSGIMMVITESPSVSAIVGCWLPIGYAGFLSMGAAYSLQIIGQKDLEPAPASLIMSLESVFAVLFGSILLGERMNGWEILGCVLMFIAVILSQIPIGQKASK